MSKCEQGGRVHRRVGAAAGGTGLQKQRVRGGLCGELQDPRETHFDWELGGGGYL